MDDFDEMFTCQLCLWSGNKNRVTSKDPDILLIYAETFSIAFQEHMMRHLLPTRFPPCRRNLNEWTAEYWREQSEAWGVRLGPLKAHSPKGRPASKRPESVQTWFNALETEIQKAIPADCASIEEAAKAWKAHVEADWEKHRAEGNGYVWLRCCDGRSLPFGPDGHPAHVEAK